MLLGNQCREPTVLRQRIDKVLRIAVGLKLAPVLAGEVGAQLAYSCTDFFDFVRNIELHAKGLLTCTAKLRFGPQYQPGHVEAGSSAPSRRNALLESAIRKAAQRTLNAFEKAGAKVHRVSDSVMKRGLSRIEERLPPGLIENMKRIDRFTGSGPVKTILIFGGGAGWVLGPHVGAPIAVTKAVQQGNAVIAG